MNRWCRLALMLCVVMISSIIGAVPATAAVDESTLIRGVNLYNAKKYVEAEKLLTQVLAAIDDGSLREAKYFGRCAKPLLAIYQSSQRHEDALRIALRYLKFLGQRRALDAKTRRGLFSDIANLYEALGQFDEAEKYLKSLLPRPGADTRLDPVGPLVVRMRLARMADAQQNEVKANKYRNEVIKIATAALHEIEAGKIATKHRVACAAWLAKAWVAIQQIENAIDVKKYLLKYQDRQRNRTPAIVTRMEISDLYVKLRKYAQAQQYLQNALQSQRKIATNSEDEAVLLDRLGRVLKFQGLLVPANEQWSQAAKIYDDAYRKVQNSKGRLTTQMRLLGLLLTVYQQAGRFDKAIEAGERLLAMRRERDGEVHPNTYVTKSDLGALYGARGRYEQAQPLLSDALDGWRSHRPPQKAKVARALNNMAVIELAVGSLPRAEALFEEALEMRKKLFKQDDLRLAQSWSNLGSVFTAQGRYNMGVVYYDRAIAIYRQRGEAAKGLLSTALLKVAMTYKSQGQLDKSARYCNKSLRVHEDAFGAEVPGSVAYYNALVALYIPQGRLNSAEQNNRRALAICLKNNMQGELVYATALHHQAQIAYLRDQFVDASDHWRKALAIQRASGRSWDIARSLIFLARIEQLQDDPEAAEPLYREALQYQATPTVHYLARTNLADILHDRGKTEEAEKLLDQAIRLLEIPRAAVTGAEAERAEHFAQFATTRGDQLSAFDLLIKWTLDAGQLDAAFQFAERGRNRTFLDQLQLAGIDLRETLSAEDAQRLLPDEKRLRVKIATLRADAIADLRSGQANEADRRRASKALDELQSQYSDAWKEIRAASPMYRELRQQGTALASLAEVRTHLAKTHGVMLFYYVGSSGAYVMVIGADEADDKSIKLKVPAKLAENLKVDEGPLTRAKSVKLVNTYLADLRDRRGGIRRGVKSDGSEKPPSEGLNIPSAAIKRGLDGTVYSEKGYLAADQGVALADVFVPPQVRQIVKRQQARSVVIVPDAALHQLPFEALLLAREPQPTYLLDEFPPITYAPSASILLGLLKRGSTTSQTATALSVGNPQYKIAGAEKLLGSLAGTSRDTYFSLGGQLPALPGTDRECEKVQTALGGERVTVLRSDQATEANVRAAMKGKQFVHLAAHGLVDQKHDNLFGAIALTFPKDHFDDGANDGFLSLAEIHTLPLGACEVAVLSACQTNVGPDRPLEAASTLAQGFLIAGARRAVCSHWSVDDESTAEMMGAFFDAIAAELQRNKGVDYAAALHAARKTIRSDSRWSAPYFWAPFVLLGPAADERFIASFQNAEPERGLIDDTPPSMTDASESKSASSPVTRQPASKTLESLPAASQETASGESRGWLFWSLISGGAAAMFGVSAWGILAVVRKKRGRRSIHAMSERP